jgi:hypothetical protein
MARFCLRPGFSTLLRQPKTKNSSMVQGRLSIGTAPMVNVTLDPGPEGFTDEASKQEVVNAVITPLVLLAYVTL